MGIFQEYVDSKGKLRKPVVDAGGGDPDPKTPPNKPPKANGAKPYANSDGKCRKNKKSTGFADMGDKELVFKYDTKGKGKAPAKIPTVEQHELAVLVTNTARTDPAFVQRLVHEMKRQGALGPFVAELFEHRATYDHMTELLEHKEYGPKIYAQFNRASLGLKAEEVSGPFTNPST